MYQQEEQEDRPYSIVVVGKYDAILNVTHRCGHVGHYRYGGEQFAEQAADGMLQQVCLNCENSAKLQALGRDEKAVVSND